MNLLFDYIVALINLNGIIDKEKVVEIYNTQNEIEKNVSDAESMMIKNKEELRKHFVEVEGRYFVHESILHSELELLLQRKADKPYYIPPKKVLLCYKDDEFYEETDQTKKLYRFLEIYVQPNNVNSMEDVFYDVLIDCQMETRLTAIINNLNRIGVTFPTEKELTDAVNLIIDFSNHTRLWSNNGFTPAEIFEIFDSSKDQSAHTTKQVGRNELCPCGSGKKYKKCCLLNA